MRIRPTYVGLVSLLALGLMGSRALASEPNPPASPAVTGPLAEFDRKDPVPREAEGVTVVEKLSEIIPLDVPFRNERGERVVLGDVFKDGLPVILTFNYSNCEMLCSLQLGAFVKALAELDLLPAKSFHIVTIGLDPNETVERARETKGHYVERFDDSRRRRVEAGWHFLTGDEASIKKVADSVGVGYRYLARRDEYVHPAALTFLSSRGMVTRYIYGIQYTADELRETIMKAGLSEPLDSAGFILSCFHYDPEAGSYAREGRNVMRFGGLAFIVLILAGFGTWHVARARREGSAHPEADDRFASRGEGSPPDAHNRPDNRS